MPRTFRVGIIFQPNLRGEELKSFVHCDNGYAFQMLDFIRFF